LESGRENHCVEKMHDFNFCKCGAKIINGVRGYIGFPGTELDEKKVSWYSVMALFECWAGKVLAAHKCPILVATVSWRVRVVGFLSVG
jgi:hypothetical protein